MKIEIIGGDSAVQKAVADKLAQRGFVSAATPHTPGPWRFTMPPLGATQPTVYSTGNPMPICHAAACHSLAEEQANAAFIVRACNAHEELLAALIAATERMEAVAAGIPVANRAKGVSQAVHVAHMASHLAQHAKIARAAIAKATA